MTVGAVAWADSRPAPGIGGYGLLIVNAVVRAHPTGTSSAPGWGPTATLVIDEVHWEGGKEIYPESPAPSLSAGDEIEVGVVPAFPDDVHVFLTYVGGNPEVFPFDWQQQLTVDAVTQRVVTRDCALLEDVRAMLAPDEDGTATFQALLEYTVEQSEAFAEGEPAVGPRTDRLLAHYGQPPTPSPADGQPQATRTSAASAGR